VFLFRLQDGDAMENLSGGHRVYGRCAPLRETFSKENSMIEKCILIVAVIGVSIAAVRVMTAPAAARDLQSGWLNDRLEMHWRYAGPPGLESPGNVDSGYEPVARDAIRQLYSQCGSY
jgi:hypothetical protein